MPKIIYFLKEFYTFLIIDFSALIASFAILLKISKSKISKKQKLAVMTFLATVLFFCLNLTLAEAYFRFVYDNSDGLGFLKVSQKWYERHVRLNGDFRRDEEFRLQKTGKTSRICAIGDSITFGYGIEDLKNRYTEVLEKSLRDEGYKVEIYNLAISGANFNDAVSTYRQYKFLNCDIILYQYVANDIRDNEKQAKILEESSYVSPITKRVLNASYFFDFIYWRLNQRYSDSFAQLQEIDFEAFENQEKLKEHLSKISQFVQQVKRDNKKMIVVIFPMFYSLDNYPGWIHTLVEAHFAKEGATVVDLLPLAVSKDVADLRASRFDAHPNEYFHDLTAKRIHGSLKELLK